jgi:hypothetical protein
MAVKKQTVKVLDVRAKDIRVALLALTIYDHDEIHAVYEAMIREQLREIKTYARKYLGTVKKVVEPNLWSIRLAAKAGKLYGESEPVALVKEVAESLSRNFPLFIFDGDIEYDNAGDDGVVYVDFEPITQHQLVSDDFLLTLR